MIQKQSKQSTQSKQSKKPNKLCVWWKRISKDGRTCYKDIQNGTIKWKKPKDWILHASSKKMKINHILRRSVTGTLEGLFEKKHGKKLIYVI